MPYVGIVLVLATWAFLARFEVVNSLLLPSPLRVIRAVNDVGPALLEHLTATIGRVVFGFTLGVLAGGLIGVAMQFDPRAYHLLDGVIETFRPVPPVAVIPFFILLFGFSEVGKVVVTVLGVCLVVVVTVVEAIERVPAAIIRWGLVAGLSRPQLFRMIIIPAALPDMRAGLRIGMALAVTLVTVSEFMGARRGIGYLVSVAKVTLTTPTLFLAIIILGWIGWGLDRLVRLFFDKRVAWDSRTTGATK
jgi:sulfonate transport system permease protein